MRQRIHQVAVFGGSRFTLIRIDDEVMLDVTILWKGIPLDVRRKSSTASTTKAGDFDFFNDGFRVHRDGFAELLVATVRHIRFQAVDTRYVSVPIKELCLFYWHLKLPLLRHLALWWIYRFTRHVCELFDEFVYRLFGCILVVRAPDHQCWCVTACAEALNALY